MCWLYLDTLAASWIHRTVTVRGVVLLSKLGVLDIWLLSGAPIVLVAWRWHRSTLLQRGARQSGQALAELALTGSLLGVLVIVLWCTWAPVVTELATSYVCNFSSWCSR